MFDGPGTDEREALVGRAVLEVAGACHSVQPLTGVAPGDPSSRGQLIARRRPPGGKLFEQPETISKDRQDQIGEAAGVNRYVAE